MFVKNVLLLYILAYNLSSCLVTKKEANPQDSSSVFNPDLKQPLLMKDTIGLQKSYDAIINSETITDDGLFKIHRNNSRFYFEVPNSVINCDVLVVNRIVKAATGIRPNQGFMGYAGDLISQNVVRFNKGPNNKLFLIAVSYSERSLDTTKNGLHQSVSNSNFLPILSSFDIKAYSNDSSSMIIDLTDYLNSDNQVFSFNSEIKKSFGLAGLQTDKSYINRIASYPINIEINTVKTYGTSDRNATYELNSSIVLLPSSPMKPRYFDERIGYFAVSYRDFDSRKGVELKSMITRWRLEPEDSELYKYFNGELVEPKKPIVYYIDPATPKKWVPYLIKGVNDWQKAFEKAGFKNAIYALEAPLDSAFSLFDARHNAIIYKPSYISNASGPHIHDPRSGEILESHINWYHNIIQLLQKWYLIQASPSDPKARMIHLNDTLMGKLIRFVIAHEVGHTLGLTHNFGASSSVPVEKLRDKKWVEQNGHTPSIMDYSRFNYVAQPEDSISESGLFPRIGIYDEWAIEWGYKILKEFENKNEEANYLNQWVIENLKNDPRLWYGPQPGQFLGGGMPDPRNQPEDLGDNAMKAGYYGIRNLKWVMSRLVEWTKEPNADYSSLRNLKDEVIAQFKRYIDHVLLNIGTPMFTRKRVEQGGPVLKFNAKGKQKEAVYFLLEELFKAPDWLVNTQVFSLVGGAGISEPSNIQGPVLERLISGQMYIKLSIWSYTLYGEQCYTFNELLNDLENGIWEELDRHADISFQRRMLQKLYIARLVNVYKNDANQLPSTDLPVILKIQIKQLIQKIKTAMFYYKEQISSNHLQDSYILLKEAIDPKNAQFQRAVITNDQEKNGKESIGFNIIPSPTSDESNIKNTVKCWE